MDAIVFALGIFERLAPLELLSAMTGTWAAFCCWAQAISLHSSVMNLWQRLWTMILHSRHL